MIIKNYNIREFKKLLKLNDYEVVRKNGSHIIYRNNNKGTTLILPDHSEKYIEQKNFYKKLIKKYDLCVNF